MIISGEDRSIFLYTVSCSFGVQKKTSRLPLAWPNVCTSSSPRSVLFRLEFAERCYRLAVRGSWGVRNAEDRRGILQNDRTLQMESQEDLQNNN